MSKPVKNMIVQSYGARFAELENAVMIDIRGIDANANNAMRNELAQKQIKITVIKNSLAKRAWADTPLQDLATLLDGPCAIVYGADSVVEVARELISKAKQVDLKFKGALMEGQMFGPDEVDRLSKYPTRDEAQGQVIQVLLGPASQVIGAAVSPGNQIASILSSIEDKLEKGEVIAKTG